ncbi:hypothetical protein CN907_12815 [Bacillus anthracis]|nr:hypothetical protein CN907_12815 [Bacillus anthracis]
MMKKILLVAIACIIIGVIGISQTYEKAVQTAEEGNKEDVIKNETLKNIEVKLDAGDVDITLLEKPQDAVITGQSAAGDVMIFNEENTNITIGNGSKKISGKTTAGDVTIEIRS